MKMIMIAYNEAIDMEVMEVLEQCHLNNYTKLKGVYGCGSTSGTHLGTDIWPGRNNVLYVAASEQDMTQLLTCIQKLRDHYGREGVKAFVWSLDVMT